MGHVLLFPQAPTGVFTKPATAALLGGPAWLSFSKPVSLGGLPPLRSSWVLRSAAGEAVSQHECRLCSAPAQERALPGMASSDPTPMGRQEVIRETLARFMEEVCNLGRPEAPARLWRSLDVEIGRAL